MNRKIKADFKKTGTSDGKKIAIKIITVVISVFALAITFLYLNSVDRAARDTIAVVRLRRPLQAFTPIARQDVESHDLVRREFDRNSMILFEDFEELVYGKYVPYFIRESSFLFIDQITDERPVRNEWMYTLMEGEEIVTIPFNYMEAGGDILLPGDTIRIRVSYEVEDENAADNLNPNFMHFQMARTNTRTNILFDSIVVMDMLNSNGRSIYEIYREVMRLEESERREVMASRDFQTSTRPRSLVLAGSPDDIALYAEFRAQVSNRNFLITLLSRAESQVHFDMLPIVETEVRSWINR